MENNEHWGKAFEEAASCKSPKILRNLFAVVLQTCSVSVPEQLWLKHKENMSEDFLHQTRIDQQNMDLDYTDDIFNKILIYIEIRLYCYVEQISEALDFHN